MPHNQIIRLIEDAQAHGFAPGLARNHKGFFVPEEHVVFKTQRNKGGKQDIARAAAAYVRSGMVLAMDGGSTTLPIAEELVQKTDAGYLSNLTIVTNSLPIADAFGSLTDARGWTDEQAPVKIVLTAGLIRPNTKALAPIVEKSTLCSESVKQVFLEVGPPSYAFVGANGMTVAEGITMPTHHELGVKKAMLATARESFIVADSSKFGIRQVVQILDWSEQATLLTDRPILPNGELDKILAIPRNINIRFADSVGEKQ